MMQNNIIITGPDMEKLRHLLDSLRASANQEQQRIPGAHEKPPVRRKCNRDVEVEDPLARPLVRVFGRPEQGERDPRDEHDRSRDRHGDTSIP